MSLRLALAKLRTPRSVMERELHRVAELTIAALDGLIEDVEPGLLERVRGEDRPMEGPLEDRRRAMAEAHHRRVGALVYAMGREEAIEEARRRLLPVGERLGMEARLQLQADDTLDDLVAAAQVLYRVLGIDLELEEREDGTRLLRYDRCALSKVYDEDTCRVMGAADEGMVRGLNPQAGISFSQRITEGRRCCVAELTFEPRGVGVQERFK